MPRQCHARACRPLLALLPSVLAFAGTSGCIKLSPKSAVHSTKSEVHSTKSSVRDDLMRTRCATRNGTRSISDGIVPNEEDLALDAFCMADALKRCAPLGGLTFFGSARTDQNSAEHINSSRFAVEEGEPVPPGDNSFPSDKIMFSFTQALGKAWALMPSSEAGTTMNGLHPIMSGGGGGMMKAANSGVFLAHAGKTPIASVDHSLAAMKATFGPTIGFSTFFGTDQELFESEGLTQECAFRAASFSQREADLVDRSAGFVIARGGCGTEWEVYEALAKIEAGLLPPGTPMAFYSPYRLEWETLKERMSEISLRYAKGYAKPRSGQAASTWFAADVPVSKHSPSTQQYTFLNNSKLLFSNNKADTLAFLKANMKPNPFRGDASQDNSSVSDSELATLKNGDYFTFTEDGDCKARYGTNFTNHTNETMPNSVTAPITAKVPQPATPFELARDAFCTKAFLIGHKVALEVNSEANKNLTKENDGRGMLVVIGSRHRLGKSDERDQALAQKIRSITGAWAKNFGEGGNFKPVATIGGGGFLDAAHMGAADANQPSVVFGLDYGPSFSVPAIQKKLLQYTFASFSQREAELIDRAAAILIAPTDVNTEWQLFHIMSKLQTKKLLSVPVVLLSQTKGWEGNKEWGSLGRRLDFMLKPEVFTIKPHDKTFFVPMADVAEIQAALMGKSAPLSP